MRFGFSTNAFRDYDLDSTVEVLGDAGYDGIEILLDDPHLYPGTADEDEVERVVGLLEEHGLEVCNCNAFMLSAIEPSAESEEAEFSRDTEAFHHPSFVELDADDRRKRVEHTKDALETAAALGAPHISVPPGGPVPKRKSDDEALDEFVEGLEAVAPTAEEVGVDVLVEPEPELLIETSDDFLDLMDRVDSDSVGCNFDAGHFFSVGEDPAELVDELAEYTSHYHIEDIPADRRHEHTQLGEGAMDIDGFLSTVEGSGYDGFVTVELYPYGETAEETAHDAMRYLREHGWA
ncbi:sugar phosphate isomerase/epimerase [Halorarum halophilum]|uniref:Sugar phosphate isomerase/epimerase n=1 Tax=Halorarum halophilum TaxID=2743090 RepID=A0A7D5KFL1_9EURY|nr:sugar phosphate isomerase/epimerase family protein [Halobaculum halophilum]QLG27696.1 sugar phosphate isomerase/epimerase [Halobaculum halophilum]